VLTNKSTIMQVKGTGLVTTRDFVKEKYPNRYDEWLHSLPAESQKIYNGLLMKAGWFPMKEGYLVPMEHIVKLFYHGDEAKGGDALGHFSAEMALTGIYKAFLLIVSPLDLMRRATSMMSTYYEPSKIEVKERSQKQVVMTIEESPGITRAFEYRVAGWCKRALELSNCKNVRYEVTQSVATGSHFTTIVFNWD
jgi:hypothetical protein